MATSKEISFSTIDVEKIKNFFDGLISQLEEDKTSMLIGTATENKADMYEKMIMGDMKTMYNTLVKGEIVRSLYEMFTDYIRAIGNIKPEKLAVSFSPKGFNVFAVVKDTDDKITDHLISSEQIILGKYYERGFQINTTIFEASDKASIPAGYMEYNF